MILTAEIKELAKEMGLTVSTDDTHIHPIVFHRLDGTIKFRAKGLRQAVILLKDLKRKRSS